MTTALYLVLAASRVEDIPNGLSVAFRPFVLLLRMTLVTWTWVVQPVDEVHLKSLKVNLVIEKAAVLQEKSRLRISSTIARQSFVQQRGG